MPNLCKPLFQVGLTVSLCLSIQIAALAEGYKVQDRVMAPWGASLSAATIVGGPNYRGEWRVHFDKTDSSRDKWIAPADLRPFAELGELKPGELLQVEIMSAWQWVEVVEVKGDQVLCHKPNHTHEDDAWYPKSQLRRAPETAVRPEAWKYPYLSGEFVLYKNGGPTPSIGRFNVQGDNLYIGDYRITDLSQIVGKWEPRFKVGQLVRNHRGVGQWPQARIDKVGPGNYEITLVKSGQKDHINEDALAEDWDYDGFYSIAAPVLNDAFPLKLSWLALSDRGQVNVFSIKDAQIKPSMDQLAQVESQLRAKYGQVPGSKNCNDCPAMVMDLLGRRKQIVMKAVGADAQAFIQNQIEGYQRHLDDARQQRYWEIPGSFGATNLAGAVQAELAQNEAGLAQAVARNKLIDPAYVFRYDRAPIVAAVTRDAADFAKLIQPFNVVVSNSGDFGSHDATAESLATAYVRKVDPQAKLLGAMTLTGGWKKDTSYSVNTSETMATISRYLSTMVLVKTQSPKYKYPVVYSLTLVNQGKGPYVQPTSVLKAFYK